jgi:hypothetical protein
MANDEQDLNKGKGVVPPATSGQGGEGNGEGSGEGETVTIPRVQLEKLTEERDNYKAGLLKRKAEERSNPAGNGGEHENDPKNPPVPPASTDAETVRNETRKVLDEDRAKNSKVLQKKAHERILANHPEYADDVAWNRALAHLRLSGEEVTVEDFEESIEDAIFLDQKKQGKLDNYIKEQAQRAEQEGRNKAHQENVMSAGGTGDGRAPTQSTPLTPAREAMARRFGHDPVEVSKIPKQRRFTIDKP